MTQVPIPLRGANDVEEEADIASKLVNIRSALRTTPASVAAAARNIDVEPRKGGGAHSMHIRLARVLLTLRASRTSSRWATAINVVGVAVVSRRVGTSAQVEGRATAEEIRGRIWDARNTCEDIRAGLYLLGFLTNAVVTKMTGIIATTRSPRNAYDSMRMGPGPQTIPLSPRKRSRLKIAGRKERLQ